MDIEQLELKIETIKKEQLELSEKAKNYEIELNQINIEMIQNNGRIEMATSLIEDVNK